MYAAKLSSFLPFKSKNPLSAPPSCSRDTSLGPPSLRFLPSERGIRGGKHGVLAPVLVSIGLIVCGGWLLLFEMEKNHLIISAKDIVVELGAASVILYSFINNNGNSYPEKFSWTIFLSGLIVGISYFIWRVLTSEKDALRN